MDTAIIIVGSGLLTVLFGVCLGFVFKTAAKYIMEG